MIKKTLVIFLSKLVLIYHKINEKICKYIFYKTSIIPKNISFIKAFKNYINRKQNITIIDIGAHTGLFSIELSRFFNIETIVAVEANPNIVNQLQYNLKKHAFCKKFIVLNKIISDKQEQNKTFYLNSFNETSSILKTNQNIETELFEKIKNQQTIHLESLTLEKLFARIPNPNSTYLLKIDVQGAEMLVLSGGINILKDIDFIWIETSLQPLYEQASLFNEVYTFLYNQNFKLIYLKEGFKTKASEILQLDLLFKNATKELHTETI